MSHRSGADFIAIRTPGSKSVTHRAFVLAALCPAGCRVIGPLLSADTRATLDCLAVLGARWRVDAGDVIFAPAPLSASATPLDCANSGTTLRLLTGLAATLDGAVTLTGDDSLRKRPNGPLLDALSGLGARAASADGRAPLRLIGPIRAGEVRFSPRVSSQYLSAALIALCRTIGRSTLHAAAPVASLPYLKLTLQVMGQFGWHVDAPLAGRENPADPVFLRIDGPQLAAAPAGGFAVEADWSTCAFITIAALIAGVGVRALGLRRDSVQGDRALVGILQRFGAVTEWSGAGDLTVLGGALHSPGRIDVGATPDLFPALCALAACTPGRTRIDGSPGLRDKECDRIAVMTQGLRALGVAVDELADGVDIRGAAIGGATNKPAIGGGAIRSHGDHRIHMAFALLRPVARGPIAIDEPDCVAVSYPGFHADHAAILAAAEVARR